MHVTVCDLLSHKLKLSVNMIRKCSCREERHVFPSTHFLQALHRQRPWQQLRSPDEDKSKPLSPSTHDELLIKCKRGPSQPFVPIAATKFRMSWCFSKISKLCHFKHLMDFLWCIDAFTATIVWSRLWWVDELSDASALIYISHNIVGAQLRVQPNL